MPKGAPEEQASAVTVDILSPWWQGTPGSFKTQPKFITDQDSQIPFIFFLGQEKEFAWRWLPFESANAAGQEGPSEAPGLSRGEAAGTAKRNCPKRRVFRMTHAIFFLSLCDSDSHFTQTFACIFFPPPWLPASRLCTQCFPTPAPHSESVWWKHWLVGIYVYQVNSSTANSFAMKIVNQEPHSTVYVTEFQLSSIKQNQSGTCLCAVQWSSLVKRFDLWNFLFPKELEK